MVQYIVQVRASAWAIGELRRRQGVALRPPYLEVTVNQPSYEPDQQGWLLLELAFSSFEAARQNLMGLGRGIEVLSPQALRLGMIDYAKQIVGLYGG